MIVDFNPGSEMPMMVSRRKVVLDSRTSLLSFSAAGEGLRSIEAETASAEITPPVGYRRTGRFLTRSRLSRGDRPIGAVLPSAAAIGTRRISVTWAAVASKEAGQRKAPRMPPSPREVWEVLDVGTDGVPAPIPVTTTRLWYRPDCDSRESFHQVGCGHASAPLHRASGRDALDLSRKHVGAVIVATGPCSTGYNARSASLPHCGASAPCKDNHGDGACRSERFCEARGTGRDRRRGDLYDREPVLALFQVDRQLGPDAGVLRRVLSRREVSRGGARGGHRAHRPRERIARDRDEGLRG